MRLRLFAAVFLFLGAETGICQDDTIALPLAVGVFEQQVHRAHTTAEGLPHNNVTRIGLDTAGNVLAVTEGGTALFNGTRWVAEDRATPLAGTVLDSGQLDRLEKLQVNRSAIRSVDSHREEFAVGADSGLYIGNGKDWHMALPRHGSVRWAPLDVRAVIYDTSGALWFASPQGVGYRVSDDEWRLFPGAEDVPFNDFTCMAAGPKGVWFGTTNGAIHYCDGVWEFRQGRRWLLDNHVRDIVVDSSGNAWCATSKGVSCIAIQPLTLAQKASFYEEEIEKYHRRTPLGYVNAAELSIPGDKSTAVPIFSDNDGHFTGLYLGAASLGYAVTGAPRMKECAAGAFRALAFLSEVTQGGTHPAPRGFIARTVLPTSEPDPNPQFDLAYDQRRHAADSLWKIIQPRWPVDASGKWYWKNDSSPDELDGHYFGYALYFDHVCKTDPEKEEVREVVRRLTDHLIQHGYTMVDYDGLATRWGHLSPDDMNRNEAWCDERGLNSFSMLTYLSIAHHVTGDQKYRDNCLELALKHGYGMNGMTQPRPLYGPDSAGHQPDDNMAFMNYYHLIRYETDPKLLSMFHHAIRSHWQYEKREHNAFANFVYAACCQGKTRRDQWGVTDLSPPRHCFEDAVDTLKRCPLDLVNWPMSNVHRTDMVPHRDDLGRVTSSGEHRDGHAFPIDERSEIYWGLSPWKLDHPGDGKQLRDGVPFLVAYYMGRAHGFLGD